MKLDPRQVSVITKMLHKNGISLERAVKIAMSISETHCLVKKPATADDCNLINLVAGSLDSGAISFNKKYTVSEIVKHLGMEPTKSNTTRLSILVDSAFIVSRSRGTSGERLIMIAGKR